MNEELQPPRLKRSLKLWHLIAYGIIIVQPTAPMGVYGVLMNIGHGHAVTAVLLAMVAMLLTAISYGRMARVYPSAGSAFTYVTEELSPRLGYIVGWATLLDYVLNPIICVIWCSEAARNVLPGVPYAFWVIGFTAMTTMLNTRGVQASSRLNILLSFGMSIVVLVFLGEAVKYILGSAHPTGAMWLQPFYDRQSFNSTALFRCTSVAVLTYIGFDGISTMAEEVENPRRNILLATVYTCIFIGLLSAIEVYLAQLAVPYRGALPDTLTDTAFVQVAMRVGGHSLFHILNATLLIANLGSALAAQFGAARVMYSMGRNGSLPKRLFGQINQRSHVPRNNVLILGAATVAGAFLLSYERGAELLNFGALIAFIAVNLAALVHYGFRSKEKVALPIAVPALGVLVCAFVWAHLSHGALLVGSIWLALGLLLAVGMRRTKGAADADQAQAAR